jgi:hypothetical protein
MTAIFYIPYQKDVSYFQKLHDKGLLILGGLLKYKKENDPNSYCRYCKIKTNIPARTSYELYLDFLCKIKP